MLDFPVRFAVLIHDSVVDCFQNPLFQNVKCQTRNIASARQLLFCNFGQNSISGGSGRLAADKTQAIHTF